MKFIRQRSKSAGAFLVILMVLLTVPYQSALAAMIETEAALDITAAGQAARNHIKTILAREDAQAVLKAQGIDPLEALARVASERNFPMLDVTIPAYDGGAGNNPADRIIRRVYTTTVLLRNHKPRI